MNPVSSPAVRVTALLAGIALLAGACSASVAGTSAPATSAPSTAATTAPASPGAGGSSTTGSTAFKTLTPGVLYVSLTDGDLPEISVGPNNTLVGTDGYWITQFANKYHLTLKLFPTTLASEILAVSQNKVDLGTTAFYTTARAKQVYYTYPFYRDVTGVYTMDTFSYSGPSSLNGKQIGTVSGYVYVPYMQQTYGTANVHIYTTIAEADAALINGQIVGLVNGSGSNPILEANGHVTFHQFTVGQLGMPQNVIQTQAYNYVNCGNSALANALNAELQSLQSNASWQGALKQYGLTSPLDVAPLQSPQQLCTP